MGLVRKISGMKRMKYLAFCLGCLILAFSCSASRQTVKSTEAVSRNTVTAENTETTIDRTVQERTTDEQERDEEVITVITVYDTSQPVDTVTWTPPVKARTMQLRRTATKARQEAKIESEETGMQIANRETNEHSERDAVVETTSRRGMNTAQRILCSVGLFVVAGIAGWLLWRWFRR